MGQFIAAHTRQTQVDHILQRRTMKKRKVYSHDDLAKAVTARERGMSWDTVRELLPTIPERTIRRRATQQRSGMTTRRTGPSPVLSQEIEDDLQTCIVGMQREGLPVTREMVLSNANEAYRVLYSPARSAGLLGDGWVKRFFSRHPKPSLRVPQVITCARNQVRQENLDHLLNQLIKHAIERKLANDRVFDVDETGFGQKTKSRKVIAVRGPKNVWTKCIDMSFHLTLVACVSASGSCLPPLFLLPGQRLNRDILSECSVLGATLAVAPKAFMNQAIFVKWLEHFAASVPSSIIRPLLLIYDGCASHYSKRIVEKAIEMKIILLLLPPNSTHILQPLDVSVFKPFKTSLRRSMDRFMIDEDVSSLTKKQAISLASSAWQNGVLAKPDNVISGFVSTGLWPISAPKMRARRELYADGGVKNGSVPSNPVWLTVRQERRTEVLFLPKPSTKCK
uniref:PREDICTED: similar to ENSANGP00000028549 putative n=1 Tax=Albugo laibachii Nc14 TaxID=890382 RepID=F0WRN2_9STRA|nr:PREDICTED: similar to ENSANGP00000028549 putative [Albugo laibachii Nc14]|eukprot:CCA23996.1 PREDICTED: similar to ENSANGP00000028549 putative [Albugo laibachii Nc14]